jgi:hypothetical protein
MTQYNCKFQIYRRNGLFARKECDGCEPDAINNKFCPKYEPVALKDIGTLEKRTFQAVRILEEEVKNKK